jgi:hypothetical protein
LKDESMDEAAKIALYNETRVAVILLFKRLRKYMDGGVEESNVEEEEEDELDYDPDFYHV